MNVLITGIDGFVGSHLADALAGRPELRLFGTTRHSGSPKASHPPAIPLHQIEITDKEQVKKVIFDLAPQKLFHIAGQAFVPAALSDPYGTFRTNIDGLINILEAVRLLRLEKQVSCSVLVVSSSEIYAPVPLDKLPIDENTPLIPSNPYAASKACADLIAQQYRAAFGVDVVIARPFNHLGPRQSELFVGSALARQIAEIILKKREPKLLVGNTETVRDFTDVRDVVQAYIRLLERPQSKPVFNVCSGRGIAVREILETLCSLSGIAIDVVQDPARMRHNEISTVIGDAGRLRASTGWSPQIPLRQTLQDLLHYWEGRIRNSE
ncbi:MAG TPA: GDP-mannose 4,6-dehydratase [Bacteroidota bacterium]|jgi:GDP-4-dehydro-6-deoxy-D-mannose reductase|nr:GDP-mannose 4,6-dehydratase [Bacteroidota bacterium]